MWPCGLGSARSPPRWIQIPAAARTCNWMKPESHQRSWHAREHLLGFVVLDRVLLAQGWLTASISDTAPITSGTVPSQIGLTRILRYSTSRARTRRPLSSMPRWRIAQTPITLRAPVSVICTNEALYLPTVRR